MRAYIFLQNQLEEADPTKKTADQLIKENSGSEQISSVQSMFAQPMSTTTTDEWMEGDESTLFKAVVDGEVDKLRSILDSGVDPSMADSEGMTPLHYAADRGNCEVVDILLSYGANANSIDCEGQTPLMLAVMCENEDVVKSLLREEVGADISLVNLEGESVMDMIDSNSGDSEAIRIMLQERES